MVSRTSPYSSPFTDYLITRSALAKTFGGIISPICLAVLRLITNSHFAGCSNSDVLIGTD